MRASLSACLLFLCTAGLAAKEPSLQEARVRWLKGDYDKALEAIDTLLQDRAREQRLLARRAVLLYLRGRWEEAEKAAEAVLKEDKEQFLARWVRAQVWRD